MVEGGVKVVGGDIPEEGALELKPECKAGCGLGRGSRSLRDCSAETE